jgi:Spx/MgsR family transcriptional regulator
MTLPTPAPTVFGIPNCDSVRKGRAWLAAQGIAHTFHDLRRQGLDPAELARWSAAVGWQRLLNRQGQTWRALDEASRSQSADEAGALALLASHPTLIKRPVIRWADGRITVGVDEAAWADHARRGR